MPAPYEIAARLTLTSNAPQVFALLSRDILGVEGGLKRLEEAFKTLNRTTVALGGALATAFGGGILLAMKKVADRGAELNNELVKMKNLGMSDAELAKMKGAAFGMHAQVPGATPLDSTKISNTIYSLFGADNAVKMLKPLVEFQQLLGATTGDYKKAEEKVLSMVRSADLMGKFVETVNGEKVVDIGKLQHFLDIASKVGQATHNRVSPAQWLNLAQQGGPALSNMTDEGLVTMAMVTQAMGGHRAGTALSSLFSQFKGGIMSPWRAQELIKLGLLPEDAIEEITRGGHIVWKEGALRTPFAKALGKDPIQAVAIMSAAMSSHGLTDPETQIEEIFKIFQRQTSVREIHDIFRNMPQMEQERKRIMGAAGTSQALANFNAESYERNIHILDAAWETLLMHVGGPLATAAIPILQKLTEVVDKLSAMAQAHPGGIQAIAAAIAGLASVFTLAGMGMMAAAIGPGGWLIAGLSSLALSELWREGKDIQAAIGYLDDLAKGLAGKLEGALKGAADSINAFADFLVGIGKKIYNFITTLGGLLNKTSFGGGGFGGGGAGGDWTAGGGLTNASYPGLGGGKFSDAIKAGFSGDPYMNAALLTYRTEGWNAYVGDHGTSFGPFQLHRGGPGSEGYRFEHETGLNLADPSTVGAQIQYVRKRAHQLGGFPSNIWHGLRHVHPNWGRASTVRPYNSGGGDKSVQANLFLDGKLVASNVVGHIMKSAALQTQASHFDGMGMYNGPAAQLNTA